MMGSFLGELIGTLIFVAFGNGVVSGILLGKTKSNSSGWIVLIFGWAMGLMVGTFAAQSIGSPNAELNPAVTIALVFRGSLNVSTALFHIAAQFVGAILGSVLVWFHFHPHFAATSDPGLKLACFVTGPAIRSTFWNFASEFIATFIFVLGIFSIYGPSTAPGVVSGLGPFLVGALLLGVGASFGGTTGFAINPARDLGSRIVHALVPIPGKGSSDWGYSWIPVLAPIAAGIVAGLAANALSM